MNEWKTMFECDKCGHVSGWRLDDCCGGCGDIKEPEKNRYNDHTGRYNGWDKVIVKWGFKGNKYNPLTWFNRGWIKKTT